MITAPIVIVAPCPLGKGAVEGWMSRISAIDRFFAGRRRIYLDFVSGGAQPGVPIALQHGEASEYRLDMADAWHRAFVEQQILSACFVYVHTVHLARYILPYYPTGRIVTDVHGIVPEEELMMGRPSHADFYEAVECVVAMNSRLLVVVTEAMKDHLRAKYPEMSSEFLVVPIIEQHAVDLSARIPRKAGSPYRAVYAGGTQVWQNIGATLELAATMQGLVECEFLSHDHAIIRDMASAHGMAESGVFRVTDKPGLAETYMRSDLGFVLRDDVAVNRVSCPTKLSEYLWFGVIPVVKSPAIGDFDRLGFCYITAEEFAIGLLPDEAGMSRMRIENRRVIEQLAGRYEAAAERLNALALPNRIAGSGASGLPVGWRHLTFPNQAEFYLFADGMNHRSTALAETYEDLEWQFDPPAPAQACRLLPLLADLCLQVEEIELTLAPGEVLDGGIAATTPGRLLPTLPGETAMLTLPRATPHLDLHLPARVLVASARVRLRFAAVGIEAAGRGGATAEESPASITIILRSDAGTRGIAAPLSTT